MPTWSGWEDQFLTAINAPTSASNRTFLDDWAAHATSNCADNPIDLSHPETRSADCHKLTSSRTAQRYATHATATRAFVQQVQSGNFNELASGFSNNLLDPANAPAALIAEIRAWGSAAFANWLAQQSGVGGKAPAPSDAFKGWTDLQRSFNKHMPRALDQADTLRRGALRTLARAHKVRV